MSIGKCQSGNAGNDGVLVQLAVDGDWLKKQLREGGKSQADLARYLKLAPPIINKIVHGRRLIKAAEADQIRAFFKVPHPDDTTAFPQAAEKSDLNVRGTIVDANITTPLRSEMDRDIPIMGTVSGGPGGLPQMANGDAVDWARRPPRLKGRTDVFGLWVEDLSMIPAFRPGSLILVEASRPPSPGDDVVIEIAPENPRDEQRALIKRLVSLSAKVVTVEQFNPPKQLEFDRRRVLHLYRVMPLADLLGV